MKNQEIIEQIELIERDYKIKPDPERRKQITEKIGQISILRARIQQTKDLEKLKARQDTLFHEIKDLLKTMIHPKEFLLEFGTTRFLTISQYPNVFLDSVTGFIFPQNCKAFRYTEIALQARNRILKDFALDGIKDWHFPKKQHLLKLFNTQVKQHQEISSSGFYHSSKIWIDGHEVDAVFDTSLVKRSETKYHSGFLGITSVSASMKTANPVETANSALFLPISAYFKPASYLIEKTSATYERLALLLYNHTLDFKFPNNTAQNVYKTFYVDYLNLHLKLANKKSLAPVLSSSNELNHQITPFSAAHFKHQQVYSLVSYPEASLAFINEAEQYIQTMNDVLKPLCEKIDLAASELKALPQNPLLYPCLQVIIQQMTIEETHPLTFIEEAKVNILHLSQQLKNISSFDDLLKLEKQATVSYPLLVEFIEQRIQQYVTRINHLATNQIMIEQLTSWYKNIVKTLKANNNEALRANWTTQLIDEEIYEQWLADLTNILEEKYALYIPILQDVLNNQLSFDTFKELDQILQKYTQQIYNLFLIERWQTHQKFAFQIGGELQEKLEIQSMMYQLVTPVIEKIHLLMKSCDASEQQSLITILQPILAVPIKQLDHLVADYTFVEDILNEFHTLKKTQLETFSKDTNDFTAQQQERAAQYNALMYKMRKQLMKQANM